MNNKAARINLGFFSGVMSVGAALLVAVVLGLLVGLLVSPRRRAEASQSAATSSTHLETSDPLPETYENRKYWGFYFLWWSAVTILVGLGTFFTFSEGATGAGFGGLGITALCALYARYLHNWGRWRMIFIVF